jgi:hypothetical protein
MDTGMGMGGAITAVAAITMVGIGAITMVGGIIAIGDDIQLWPGRRGCISWRLLFIQPIASCRQSTTTDVRIPNSCNEWRSASAWFPKTFHHHLWIEAAAHR